MIVVAGFGPAAAFADDGNGKAPLPLKAQSALSTEESYASIESGVYTIETAQKSGVVLDVAGGSTADGANVQLYASNNTVAQKWRITHVRDGWYSVVNVGSGKALEVAGGSKVSGANVQQYANSTSDNQLWRFYSAGSGRYKVVCNSGCVLDAKAGGFANGTNVQVYTSNDTIAQRWNLVALPQPQSISLGSTSITLTSIGASRLIGATMLPEGTSGNATLSWASSNNNVATVNSSGRVYAAGSGTCTIAATTDNGVKAMCSVTVDDGAVTSFPNQYEIHTALKAGVVIDVAAGSMTDGTNIQLYAANDTIAQKWRVVEVANGWCKIVNSVSGKVLDVAAGSSASDTNVQLYSYNGTAAQLWRFYKQSDGSYRILSKLGCVLDADNAKTANGTNVKVHSSNGETAQKWNLVTLQEPTSLSLNASKITLGSIGASRTLSATAQPAGSSKNVSLSWKTSDANVAAVTSAGLVKAAGSGTCTITATTSNGVSASCSVVVDDGAAEDLSGIFSIETALKPGVVIDVAAGSSADETNIQLYASNNTFAQKWRIVQAGYGWCKVLNASTGKALDVKNGAAASGANVQIYSPNGTDAQLWRFHKLADGAYRVANKLGYVLDANGGNIANGTNVQVYASNGTKAQQWKLVPLLIPTSVSLDRDTLAFSSIGATRTLKATMLPEGSSANVSLTWKSSNPGVASVTSDGVVKAEGSGTCAITATTSNGVAASCAVTVTDSAVGGFEGMYRIDSALQSGMCIDVAANGTTNGTNVQLYASNDTSAQKWRVTEVSNGWCKITNAASGKALDVTAGKAAPGTNVQLYSYNGTAAQLWRLFEQDDGSYTIMNKLGCMLDVSSSQASNGVNVRVYTATRDTKQKWNLVSLDEPDEVRVRPTEVSLSAIGATTTLTASVAPAATARNTFLTWTSSDPAVATVNALGVVTAAGNGSCTITVSTSNGKKASTSVTVRDNCITNLAEGYYVISTRLASNKVLDCANFGRTNGANVQICTNWTDSGVVAQVFKIKPVSNGWYKILSYLSNDKLALDVTGGSSASGTNVQLYADNGTAAQLWRFYDAGNGFCTIVNKLGCALDVRAAATDSGTNVQVYRPNSTSAQQWRLRPFSVKGVKGISINSGGFTLTSKGEAKQLSAIMNPSDATAVRIVDWSSSNPGVATVSSNGLVTAISTGEATITAKSFNDKTASVKVSVSISSPRPEPEPDPDGLAWYENRVNKKISKIASSGVQCVAYVRYRLLEKLNVNTGIYGNGKEWYGKATAFKRGQTPRSNSIACWAGGGKGYGHVAIVEYYDQASQTVYFTEANCSAHGNGILRKAGVAKFKSHNPLFQGFIYI